MAKIAIFSVALVLVAISCIESANGIECYQCSYTDADTDVPGFPSDKSCKNGKKPDKDTLHTCEDEDWPSSEMMKVLGFTNTSINIPSPKQDLGPFGCGKIVADLGTIRGCVRLMGLTQDLCKEDTVENLGNHKEPKEWIDGWGRFFQAAAADAGELKSTQISACICSGEKCNSAFTTTTSVTVILASVALAFLGSRT